MNYGSCDDNFDIMPLPYNFEQYWDKKTTGFDIASTTTACSTFTAFTPALTQGFGFSNFNDTTILNEAQNSCLRDVVWNDPVFTDIVYLIGQGPASFSIPQFKIVENYEVCTSYLMTYTEVSSTEVFTPTSQPVAFDPVT